MKILMVCTFPHGGASIAARRQADALRSIGQKCDFVSIKEDWNNNDLKISRDGHEINISVPSSEWSYSGLITSSYCENNRTEISNTWFSFWPCETFLDEILFSILIEYDVIHFHWIAQIVSSKLLDRLSNHNRRIVITGHDMNHFTAGCHYSAGCDQFSEGCSKCPMLLVDPLQMVANSFNNKISAFANLNATWIFPSEWLANEFRKSQLQDKPNATKVFYNCIDIKRFRYLPKEERISRRLASGFAENEMVFVAGAGDNTELRKGFDYVEHAIENLSVALNNKTNHNFCVIVTFGRGEPSISTQSPYIRHLHLGPIDESRIIELFQVADLLLFSSIEENFSNTILESLMCGCPLFAFRIGGVPDIVVHQTNGCIVDSVCHEAFANELVALAEPSKLNALKHSTHLWRDQHAEYYGYQQNACGLFEIYQDTTAVTQKRAVDFLPNIATTENIYQSLFGKIYDKDPQSHRMLKTTISRHINLAQELPDFTSTHQSPYKIPAIFNGFGVLEKHDQLGSIAWLLSEGRVFFKPCDSARPGLCIKVSNTDWIIATLEGAINNLEASVNSYAADVYFIKSQIQSNYAYLWIITSQEAYIPNVYNCLRLSFSQSSVPESQDSRGLCVLHCDVGLFDLNQNSSQKQELVIPDFETSTALMIEAGQYVSLWQDESQDRSFEMLQNSLHAWMDVIHCTKNEAECLV